MTQPTAHTFEAGLADATAAVRAACRRKAAAVAIDRASRGLAVTGLTAAGCGLGVSWAGGPTTVTVGVAALGVAITAVRAATPFVAVRSRQSPVGEIAERLDLAAATRNAIATGLEFARRDGPTSAFARRAIDDGLAALEDARRVAPAIDGVPLRLARAGGRVCLGLVAATVTLFVGNVSHSSELATNVATDRSLPIGSRMIDDASPVPPPAKPRAVDTFRRVPVPAAKKVDASESKADAAKPAASAAVGDADAGPASAARNSDAAPGQAPPRPSPAAKPAYEPDPSLIDPKGNAPAAAAAAGARSSPSRSAGQPAGGTNPAAPTDGEERPSQTPNDVAGKSSASVSPPPEEIDKGEPGGGEGKDKKDGKPNTNTGSNNSQGEGTGGNGQSGGQNPPKKSRGVAPMLLGSLQPDLLQGRQLPGPDERSSRQVPPQPRPETPAPPAPAGPRQGDENPVNVYRVPAESRAAVNRYLEQFHAEPDAAKPAR